MAKTCPWSNYELGVNIRSALNSTSAVDRSENTSWLAKFGNKIYFAQTKLNHQPPPAYLTAPTQKPLFSHSSSTLMTVPIEWFLVFFQSSLTRSAFRTDWLHYHIIIITTRRFAFYGPPFPDRSATNGIIGLYSKKYKLGENQLTGHDAITFIALAQVSL